MNRSILIVIADFLLVSLLAFSSFDVDKLGEERPDEQLKPKLMGDDANPGTDLAGAMRVALEDERQARERLVAELKQNEAGIREQQTVLAERERQREALQESIRAKEVQSRQLEQERRALSQQFAAAQTNIQALQQQLKATSTGALLTQRKLEATESDLRRQQEQLAAAQQQLADSEKSRQALEGDKRQLTEKLQVSEAEKRAATQQVASLQGEMQAVRTEKAQLLQHADKLAEGVTVLAQSSDKLAERVSALATNSGELTKEVRDYRPLAANSIFSDYAPRRVHAQFFASRGGLLGITLTKRRETDTMLVSDGTNTFAVCHLSETPLSLSDPGMDWETLTGSLERGSTMIPIERISLYLLDPRLVLIPLTEAQVRQLGAKVYHLAQDPFKFRDAVLVGAREGYYGECDFRIDLSAPQYVKMDRGLFRGLFGKFNPSRGDLVLSKTGELLGVMANSTYCVVMHNFTTAATIQFGQDVRAQRTGDVLARFFRLLNELPFKLR